MSVVVAPERHRTDPSRPTRPLPDVVRWCWSVLAWTVALAATLAVVVAVLVPRVGGATPYTILTGSMRPTLPPGTLVVARPVDPGQVGLGSVITYQLRSGEARTVTHRVVEVGSDLTGERSWRTQGDANDVADAEWVREEQVRGELWYAVPHLGRASSVLGSEQRELGVRLVAGALLVYAASAFLRAARQRARR